MRHYLEPPAQAVGVFVDRSHLAVTLLAQLHHRVHETLDLQLSATGEKPTLGRPLRLPEPQSRPHSSRGRRHLPLVRRDHAPSPEVNRAAVPTPPWSPTWYLECVSLSSTQLTAEAGQELPGSAPALVPQDPALSLPCGRTPCTSSTPAPGSTTLAYPEGAIVFSQEAKKQSAPALGLANEVAIFMWLAGAGLGPWGSPCCGARQQAYGTRMYICSLLEIMSASNIPL